MRYTDLARAMNNDPRRIHQAARAALVPYLPGVNPAQTRENLRETGSVGACPWLLDVPRRVLKRWAMRAVRQLPRAQRLTGPALAMHRRGVV